MTTELTAFRTAPMLDLDDPQIRERLGAALRALDEQLPLSVHIRIGEEKVAGSAVFTSHDPGLWERVIASAHEAGTDEVAAAIATVTAAQPAWAQRSTAQRAELLRTAADLLQQQRPAALALLVRECAKTWLEADAEFCEAIDFLLYYASAAVDLNHRDQLLQGDGEHNRMLYEPRGVAAAIIPWNFPLAIGLGMTVAPLVMGNAVIVKPAEQTPAVGQFLHQLLLDAGVPAGVIALLPGAGQTGAALVGDPRVDTLVFTGSRQVGLNIIERAGKTDGRQKQIKKVIAEMGGKNCIIVDETADIAAAVDPILRSAFAFGGQKCSAAARVLAHRSVIDELCARLGHRLSEFTVGAGEHFDTDVTALIEPESQQRVQELTRRALADGQLVATLEAIPDTGCFVAPTIVRDLPPASPLLADETFGPLLTVEPFDDLSDALDRIDRLPYALTGGVFSRSETVIAEVIRRSPVGNLYINRKITGAFVGRQPFGGNRMSGIGTKAGSADYLLQFVHAKVVCHSQEAS